MNLLVLFRVGLMSTPNACLGSLVDGSRYRNFVMSGHSAGLFEQSLLVLGAEVAQGAEHRIGRRLS